MITVMITFRKCNKISLECQAGIYQSRGGGDNNLYFKLTESTSLSNISVDSITTELTDYGLTKTDKRKPDSSASH
jgi:hypothetical protein